MPLLIFVKPKTSTLNAPILNGSLLPLAGSTTGSDTAIAARSSSIKFMSVKISYGEIYTD